MDILLYSSKSGYTKDFMRLKRNRNGRLMESKIFEGMKDDCPPRGRNSVDKIMDFIMEDKWISAVYSHYLTVRDDKDDEHKFLTEALRRYVSKKIGIPIEFIKVILGYYLLVIDTNIMFQKGDENVPAYIHMAKKDTGEWTNSGVFKRGH